MNISLKTVLIIPFVLQVVGTTALVGYLSYRSGQRAVEDLAEQLMDKTAAIVDERLTNYLGNAHRAIARNRQALESGRVDGENLEAMQAYFFGLLNLQDNLADNSYITLGYGSATGKSILVAWDEEQASTSDSGYVVAEITNPVTGVNRAYRLDRQGQRVELIQTTPSYDPRQLNWYTTAAEKGEPAWTPIYSLVLKPHPGLLAVTPVYNNQDQLQGVLFATVLLSNISTFLGELDFASEGHVFIIERSGALVATSGAKLPLITDVTSTHLQGDERINRLSQDPLTQVTTQAVLEQVEHLDANQQVSFNFRGPIESGTEASGRQQRYFATAIPYQDARGIDWIIVTMMPESNFASQIHANVRNTIGLAGLAALGAIALGTWTTRRIARPILALNQATQAFANGNFLPKSPPSHITEIEALQQALYEMAADLSVSIQTLRDSEQKFITLMDQLPIGVGVFDNRGNVLWSNRVAQQILNGKPLETDIYALSSTYQAYRAGTDELYPTEELPALRSLKGEVVYIDDIEIEPFNKVADLSGRRVPLEVRSAPVHNTDGEIIYAIVVFQDISERKQTQQLLKVFNESTDAMFLVDPNTSLSVECNATAIEMFEATHREQLLGIDGKVLQKRPFTSAELGQIKRNLMKHGFYSLEAEYITLRGQSFWGELSIKQMEIGGRSFILVRVIDISDRKAAELALRESETRFQTISDTSPANIYCLVQRVDGSFYFEHISQAIETIQEISVEAILDDARFCLTACIRRIGLGMKLPCNAAWKQWSHFSMNGAPLLPLEKLNGFRAHLALCNARTVMSPGMGR